MNEWAEVTALWLGFSTSVSPCLLATNVTAVSFIARRVEHPRYILLSGLCYTAGQAIAFVLLAALLVSGLLTVPIASYWLQKYMFRLLGPILILCAMLLLKLFDVQLGSGRMKAWAQDAAQGGGFWASALLGIIFAMSFCPTTAALYFGGLLPMSIEQESSVYLPLIYALGVALPVLAISVLVATASHRLAAAYAKVGQIEPWARRVTGCIFLAVGVYFTLAYTLELI